MFVPSASKKHFMKAFILFLFLLFHLTIPLKILIAQATDPINLDEAKIEKYTLPDVLKTADGKKIKSARQWNKIQRPAILSLFEQHVYGKMPGRPPGMHLRVNAVNENALGGKAISKQVTIFFTPGTFSPGMEVLLYLPKNIKIKVPVFVGLNFYGNQSTAFDTSITITNRWTNNNAAADISANKATVQSRGLQATRWNAENLIENGYGLATAYYGDLEPDHAAGFKDGIRTSLANVLSVKPEEWSAIGAWAWGLSRMLDYLETESLVNAKKVIVTGHSRLGKAALWAGASDTRFAAVISNNSGEGGAALARRNFGETTLRINNSFPHWFAPAFKKYNARPETLPVDQHMLLALIAPRPLYVASSKDDLWADPRGEFLSALNTEPVYALFKKTGLGITEMPGVDSPAGQTVRYHIRTGKHDITTYDWEQYIKFANDLLKNN